MFLIVGESKYQSYVYFQALLKGKSCFLRKFYSQHILISLHKPSNNDNDRPFDLIPKLIM